MDPVNEIWPGFTTSEAGIGNGNAVKAFWARPEAQAVVIHDVDGARIACADLLPERPAAEPTAEFQPGPGQERGQSAGAAPLAGLLSSAGSPAPHDTPPAVVTFAPFGHPSK
ncbi:MAG: hypothetical protein IT318_15450 [Anaerolineales bacterium]|nr:hypothetical protein [Anaerolineales bacterium]